MEALVAGVVGQGVSTYSARSRSVPGWVYWNGSVVTVGLATGKVLTQPVLMPVWAGVTATLGLVLGRWDNARAELAPRWEAHGRGATCRASKIWATSLVWCVGFGWAKCWLSLWKSESKAARIVAAVGGLGVAFVGLATKGVSHPGGPRPRPIGRKATFAPGPRPGPSTGWRFASGEESHRVTAKSAPAGVELTGEAAGRQIWYFDPDEDSDIKEDTPKKKNVFDPSVNPNGSDLVFRESMIRAYVGGSPPAGTTDEVVASLRRGLGFYRTLQCDDGHFAGDYGGPHFLSPGLVIAWYVLGKKEALLDAPRRKAMALYYRNHQQADGGWGTHVESPSTMFGSVLTYVALRLLGEEEDTEVLRRGLEFIRANGGAPYTSSWAKFGLCLLGAMDWDGHESVPPEMWLLPEWVPFHPCRMWCHARMVYLPMSYLWGSRWVYPKADCDPLIAELRDELYLEPYHTIDWYATRSLVAPMDNYSPVHPVMKLGQRVLRLYETSLLLSWFRRKVRAAGLKFAARYVYAEDQQTNYVDIGPVNKVYNMLVAAVDDTRPDFDVALKRHCLRVPDYLWVAEDGMKMQGYNGSQCWDTSFFTQALVESRLGDDPHFRACASKAYEFLEKTQILSIDKAKQSPAFAYENPEERRLSFRHVSKGGWPFSTSAHGWPISDCTAEGLKSVLAMQRNLACVRARKDGVLGLDRLADAVEVILTLQNHDGGWATYENNRGYGWYEWLNPSEVFGDIMIDYSYVECSMACATALRDFARAYPAHRPAEIATALKRSNRFLKSIQRPDGAWYGSWGCCFTYAAWFGIEGLVATGEPASSPAIQKACAFLVAKQRPDGVWGETFESCFDKAYSDGPSHVVNTAWALLGLMEGDCPDLDAVDRGIAYLLNMQLPSGDWPQQGISGVFNRACGITYTAYRNVFPLWALARYHSAYKPKFNPP